MSTGLKHSSEVSIGLNDSSVVSNRLSIFGKLAHIIPLSNGMTSSIENVHQYISDNMGGYSDNLPILDTLSTDIFTRSVKSELPPEVSFECINTKYATRIKRISDTKQTKVQPTTHLEHELYDINSPNTMQLDSHGRPAESVVMDLRMLKVTESEALYDSGIDSVGNSPHAERMTGVTENIQYYETKPQPRMLKFPPCEICSGKASGLHYGCNTCEACKNFFRRYLIRNQRYKCVKENTCVISSVRKGNCSECRLSKCLLLGMSKDKSKMGRYSYSRRTETINRVRELEGKDHTLKDQLGELNDSLNYKHGHTSSLGNDHVPQPFVSNGCFNEEEMGLIEHLIADLDEIKPWGEILDAKEARQKCLQEHYDKYVLKESMFGKLNNISNDKFQTTLRDTAKDLNESFDFLRDCGTHWDRIVGQYCKFAKNIPGFKHLSYSDQEMLLKATHFDFFSLLLHQGYDSELKVFLEINGMPYHIEESADKFFSRRLIVGICDLYGRLQKLVISKEEMVLLTSIVTLSSDNCEVQNTEIVQSGQEFVTNILIKLLKYTLGEVAGIRKFTKFVDCLLEIRRLGVIYSREYSGLWQHKQFQGVFKETLTPHKLIPCTLND